MIKWTDWTKEEWDKNIEDFPFAERLNSIAQLLSAEEALSIHKNYKTMSQKVRKNMHRGIEVFRILYSYEAALLRGASRTFLDEGIIIHHDVFPDNIHQEVLDVCLKSPLSVNSGSATKIKGSSIERYFDTVKEYVFDAIGLDEPTQFWNTAFIQRLHKNSKGHLLDKSGRDVQLDAHADIFAPSLKWWYFPEDVYLEHGPLNYALKSCAPTETILKFWHRQSSEVCEGFAIPPWKEPGHSEGSLRVSSQELESMGLEMTPIICKANTLVVANVHGFHARGVAQDPETNIRNAVHGSIRTRPFESVRR